MAKGPAAFVRDATGLVRNVSLLDAIALNISNMGGAGILAILGYTTVLLPSMAGVNLVYASIIGLVISVPQIIVYTMMTQRMPRTGGDYVWISRTFGGFVGGVGALAGFMLADIPFISLAALATVFAIGSVAVTEGFSGFMGLALPGNIPGANTVAQFLLASIIVIGLILINMLRPKLGYRIVSLLTIIGVISTVVGICSLLAAGTGGVVNYVNSLGIANTTYTSIASSYSGSTFDPAATGMVVPFFIAFGYIYLNAAPAVASEIKGKNTLRWNVPVSVGLQFLLLTAGIGAMYYAGGFNFINAAF
jgi:amino acid transporter